MPWVLSDCTCAVYWVYILVFACRDCGAVTNGLLRVNFYAMSSGLVSILFCLSMMESRGEVSMFLKTLRFIFLGFFSYI